MDFLALKSGEYSFLLSTYDSLNPLKQLEKLPNWAFSRALALFHQESHAKVSLVLLLAPK